MTKRGARLKTSLRKEDCAIVWRFVGASSGPQANEGLSRAVGDAPTDYGSKSAINQAKLGSFSYLVFWRDAIGGRPGAPWTREGDAEPGPTETKKARVVSRRGRGSRTEASSTLGPSGRPGGVPQWSRRRRRTSGSAVGLLSGSKVRLSDRSGVRPRSPDDAGRTRRPSGAGLKVRLGAEAGFLGKNCAYNKSYF